MAPFDLLLGGVARFAAEAPWARRLVLRCARGLAAQERIEIRDRRPTVGDLRGRAPLVLVEADPEAFLLPGAAGRLLQGLEREGCDVAIPATNEPWCEDARFAPPFPYHTPAMLAEAVAWTAQQGGPVRQVARPRSPVYAARRAVLDGLPADLSLEDVPEAAARRGARVCVDPGSYLHRYGNMDGQARADLVGLLPAGSRSVLDVGCSRAATAPALRKAGVERVVGIEPDPGDAQEAALVCDRVIASPLEDVAEDFSGQFDAILFGDVLEHLIDPSDALVRVRPWLSPPGAVIASVPNLGHWSVLADLLEGRFEYIPYSILSGTHVRFFTRRTLADLFEACGYQVGRIETVTFPPSPAGSAALARLSAYPGASEDLTAVEFLIVASPSPPRSA